MRASTKKGRSLLIGAYGSGIFISDPMFTRTFYSGAGFLAEINCNPNCIYYTAIGQDHQTLDLVECLPGVYTRVVLVSYDDLGQPKNDYMDYADTASFRLASFLNGRRMCSIFKKPIETGDVESFGHIKDIAKEKKFLSHFGKAEFTIIFFGVKMRVSMIIKNEYLSDSDDPEECITDAINAAVLFCFDPIDENNKERNN